MLRANLGLLSLVEAIGENPRSIGASGRPNDSSQVCIQIASRGARALHTVLHEPTTRRSQAERSPVAGEKRGPRTPTSVEKAAQEKRVASTFSPLDVDEGGAARECHG